jgi:SAM-dependent methyltransferase
MALKIDHERFEAIRAEFGEIRSKERIEAHLACELRLAERLRNSPVEERRAGLYTQIYSELFRTLPDHPQHRKAAEGVRADVECQVDLLRQVAPAGCAVAEIGAGDAAVSRLLASSGYRVTAVDVSDGVADREALAKAGVSFLLTDGLSMPLETASVDLAYSNQLIEHLHPDDAFAQLVEVRRTLRNGGTYYVVTPHRLTGPHDVSVYLGGEAQGLHLREYDYRSLAALARRAGFRGIAVLICRGPRVLARMPYGTAAALETAVALARRAGLILPRRSRLARMGLGIHALLQA